ncbi:MAG: DUF2007 domain-containing protein [Bacteroidales bacterium]|jgi:hypothetical protein|nr:DUF2007 domain-containing protein [Bacteroidales bacterium]
MDNWICVYTTNQRYRAEIVKNLLGEENIEAVILDKKDSSYTVFGEIEVFVPPEDQNFAEELIKSANIE